MKDKTPKKYKFQLSAAKKPPQKRIDKVRSRPLKSFNVLYAYFMFTFRWRGLKRFAPFILHVIQKFFLVQYLEKFHILHIPVKHVDHQLDTLIPYKPAVSECYLDFVNYWIRPMCMIMHRYGSYQGMKITAEYVSYMILTYKESYRIYQRCLSTTRRPTPLSKAERNLQFWDPHYLCIPSLHISIIALTIGFYRMLFVREGFPEDEARQRNAELFTHGIEIAESVLYMKQHSVNCISAALFMITKIDSELFTREYAHEFIQSLFRHCDDVPPDTAERIRDHILTLYEKLMSDSEGVDDWTEAVMAWLQGYVPYEG